MAQVRKCFGCEEIQHKQKEIPESAAASGMKVLLLPASIAAAEDVARRLT